MGGDATIPLGDGFAYTPGMRVTESHERAERGDTFMHNNIHRALAVAAVLVHVLRTGAKECHLALYHATATGAPVEMEFTYGGAYTGGSAAQVLSKNFMSSVAPTTSIIEGATITAAGTHAEGDIIAGGKLDGGSQAGIDAEWILAPNSTYIFNIKNTSNQAVDVSFHIEWYETE